MFSIAREIHGAAAAPARIQKEIERARIKAERLVRKHRPAIECLAEQLIKLYACIDKVKQA